MSEYYQVTIEPAEEPVTLAEVKAFMRWTSTSEDALITDMIVVAREAIELYTGQYFIERTVQGDFDSVFTTNSERYPWVKLRRAPLKSVTSVQVSISDTFTDESYQLKRHTHGFSRILFDDLTTSLDDVPYPLQVVFIAGYGDADDVPETIKMAIMQYVNFIFKNRADCVNPGACATVIEQAGFPAIAKGVINRYRIIEVFA
jgi:uncharacterized phiE125 gp8 family phage protein